MKYPNFKEEKQLWKKGFELVAGLDESGRGPLAGPVVAVAVMININQKKHSNILKNIRMLFGLRDSKQLSPQKREYFYKKLTNHKNIVWGVGIVSEKVIDKINILEATKLAMKNALDDLCHSSCGRTDYGIADFLLIDGNFGISSKIPQKSIIKGDQKVFSIAAASIIAKVTRDRMMQKLHQKYPNYGFDSHKGYSTKKHVKNLYAFGLCKIHRKTFEPIKSLAKNEII